MISCTRLQFLMSQFLSGEIRRIMQRNTIEMVSSMTIY